MSGPKLLILSMFFIGYLISAQDADSYNRIYRKTFLEVWAKDPKDALRIADSLYQKSETPHYKAKSLMLSATLYQQQSDLQKAVSFAERSESIFAGTDEYEWQSRIYGFLATQYRLLKLYIKSKEYAQKAVAINSKIKEPAQRNVTMGMMLQEMAYYEISLKNYQSAITNIKKAQRFFDDAQTERPHFTGNNHQLLGDCYYSLANYPQAITHYKLAEKNLAAEPDGHLMALTYNGLAKAYLEEGNMGQSKIFLAKVQKMARETDFPQLKSEVYETERNFYAKNGQHNAYNASQKKLDIINDNIEAKGVAFINNSYRKMENKAISDKAVGDQQKLLIVVWIIIFIMVVAYMMIRHRNQKREFERFKKKYFSDRDESLHPTREAEKNINYFRIKTHTKVAEELAAKPYLMTSDTVQRLLKQLEEFEKSDLFLHSNISLSMLAAKFGTNTKYLSHIINTYRKKDFNNYINSLRIRYITQKLTTSGRYRQYKISALAEECGFSSQAKFSTIFKNETSFSPTAFLRFIEKETNVLPDENTGKI
ncbi:AraC-type DNA-binding protein [Epilithonimonas bovis DSM 19482]|uniref:AraC-type DNA-binding protein n=1 Tax=Epilithonimonas bovis DSM 19482 TaxID=1121284 RepID=A0A1U7PYW5_9FLAO|nr:helix-turn-helix domain-containing protein [Epilithonimonas bovis]SIT97927.1 AraC-type DNA-binding protein [Epilithonimonas bovis DSM 19482]